MNWQLLTIGKPMALPLKPEQWLLMLVLSQSLTVHAAGDGFFCCHDALGKQVCGDTLPAACYGRAYREVSATGQTSRTVDAPLTAEQRAQRAEAEAVRKRDEEKRKEQQRKDQALLNTYGSEQDIAVMRKRAEGDVFKAINDAEQKIAEIRKQRKKFENEAEFYKKKPLPFEVQKGLSDAESDIIIQENYIADKKKELESVRAKYDEDKRRFLELMAQSGKR